jgi:hypothetical protein
VELLKAHGGKRGGGNGGGFRAQRARAERTALETGGFQRCAFFFRPAALAADGDDKSCRAALRQSYSRREEVIGGDARFPVVVKGGAPRVDAGEEAQYGQRRIPRLSGAFEKRGTRAACGKKRSFAVAFFAQLCFNKIDAGYAHRRKVAQNPAELNGSGKANGNMEREAFRRGHNEIELKKNRAFFDTGNDAGSRHSSEYAGLKFIAGAFTEYFSQVNSPQVMPGKRRSAFFRAKKNQVQIERFLTGESATDGSGSRVR